MPTAVALYRRIEKSLHLGKCDDLVELLPNLALRHPKDGAIKEDVLAPCQLGMKTRSDLEQARNASTQQNSPLRRFRDAAQDLEQRALAGTVAANDANNFTLLNLEAYVLERPEFLDLIALNDLSPAKQVDCFAHEVAGLATDDVA